MLRITAPHRNPRAACRPAPGPAGTSRPSCAMIAGLRVEGRIEGSPKAPAGLPQMPTRLARLLAGILRARSAVRDGRAAALVLCVLFFGSQAAAETMTLDEVEQGMLLRPSEQAGSYHPMPLQRTEATLRVVGPVVRGTVVQSFQNDSDRWAEAVYAFPLPEDAAVDHLRMHVGERTIVGEIKEREEARAAYEGAKAAGQQASLLEQQRPNLFTTAVANIPPRGEIQVEIQYQHLAQWRDGRFSLRFPLGITPRYRSGSAGTLAQSMDLGGGWAILPGAIENEARILPPTAADGAAAEPLNPVDLTVHLDPGFALAALASPYHAITREDAEDGETLVRLAGGPQPARRDFELRWSPAAGQAPAAAFFLEEQGDAGYGLLMLMPPAGGFADQPSRPREIVFIVDTSGSMGGASIAQAKEALSFALDQLAPEDRFAIIAFDSTTRALFDAPVVADADHLARARWFVRDLAASGGTEMRPALELALGMPAEGNTHLRQILFITDGAVFDEEQLFATIEERLGDRRLFTVGIGSAPNGYFMTEAARFGRGTYTYIGDPREVADKMTALFDKIAHPALTDIEVRLPVPAERVPDPIADLYLGEPVVALIKTEEPLTEAEVEGNLGDFAWRTKVALRRAAPQSGLGVLWARERIADLMRDRARGMDPAAVRAQVLELALTHHLVSEYTSLVAVDPTPARPAEEGLESAALPIDTPAGFEPAVPGGSIPYAQGATPSLLYLSTGLLLALAALLMMAASRRAGVRAESRVATSAATRGAGRAWGR